MSFNQTSKQSPFHTLEVTNYNCFFSEICEISHSELQQRQITQSYLKNCLVTFDTRQLFIITRGGTKFNLPMDQNISRVYPLVEGILIEFHVKPQIKFHEILFYQNNKNKMQIEQPNNALDRQDGRFCYATLTRHPLNPLKNLGAYKHEKNDDFSGWLKTDQQIIDASDSLPLLVSYNKLLRRNAFHVLIVNMAEIHREYQFAFEPTLTYSLESLQESPHYQVISMLLFEESMEGERIKKVCINKSIRKGHIMLYALSQDSDLKIYEISFFGTAYNSTKLIRRIPNIKDITHLSLYNPISFVPRPFKDKNESELVFQILYEQINRLDDCVAMIHSNDSIIGHYHSGQLISMKKFSSTPDHALQECTQIIQDPFDSLVLRSLEICLVQESIFVSILSKYCSGLSLSDVLLNVLETRREVFNYMHILFQELKLYELMKEERKRLGTIMIKLAQKLGKKQYIDYYSRQGYILKESPINQVSASSLHIQDIYDIFESLDKIIFKKPFVKNPIYCLYNRSQFVLKFFEILINGNEQLRVESCSKEQGMNLTNGNEYLYKSAFPLLSQKAFHLQYFNQVYENQLLLNAHPESKEQHAFIFLIKNNQNHDSLTTYPLAIRAMFNWLLREMRKNLPFSLYQVIPQLGFNLIRRQDLYKNIQLYKKKTLTTPYHIQKPSFDDHIKTLIHTSNSQEYFLTSNASQMNKTNNDLVFEEVDRLLSSASQIKIKVKDLELIPENRWEQQAVTVLLKLANRKLAVMIGQGAFNLATSTSFITDIIKIPKINLGGIMPTDIKIALDLKDDKQSIVHWPEFHSGIVAGLKLSRHVIPLSQDHLKTWIFYQKPDTPKRDHSGFLLSLGLQGYLKCFSPTDIYQYLKPNNQFTSVAILLGISASNISNSDESLSKTLFLHIPALLPPSIDVEIPINVQTSALIGLGLIHKGSCNRTMTETTLSQIGKRPSSDKCMEREGYSLAAGWALGMICLGMRDKKESFRDLQIEERLIRFIEGGKKMEVPQSMTSTNYINQSKCSNIKEGSNVNLHVTASAALLAISLMYLKSNNQELASRISIPNSFSTIQQCNPNHILLKTLAKNLIMWKDINNTYEFVLSQVPQIIKFIYDSPLNKVYERYYLVYNVSEIDYQTVTSIYANVTTGAVLSMAFKYAGSGNTNVVETIKKHLQHLKSMKTIKCEFANDPMNKNCLDQYELFSLLSTTILSLSVVMAGTCDIDCLKIIRVVRKKFQDSKVFHYGFNMVISMAIGFLFLGYGNYTFNRQDTSIAALLISIFPQFPNSPSDNRWHLQALRHFYVLAMEQKIFHAVDVDTNKVVNVNAQMEFQLEGNIVSESVQTPVLLQESKKLVQIKIRDSDYFDVDFTFKRMKNQPRAIYIKRKYFRDVDPTLLNPENPLVTQSMLKNVQDTLDEEIRYKSIFKRSGNSGNGQNPTMNSTQLSYILKNADSKKLEQISNKIQENRSKVTKQFYYKLLKEDMLQTLQIYLTLKQQLKHMIDKPTQINDSLILSNVPLLLNFQKWQGMYEFKNVIESEIEPLKHKLLIENKDILSQYLLNPHQTKLPYQILYRLLALFKIPQSKQLIVSKEAVKKVKGLSSKTNEQQSIAMLFYMSFPQSSFEFLNLASQTYMKSRSGSGSVSGSHK